MVEKTFQLIMVKDESQPWAMGIFRGFLGSNPPK